MGSGAVPPQTQEDGLVVTVVLACETKEHLAGGCQVDSSGVPDKELDVELLLEGLDLLGQRRLRDVRVLRGVGEILGSCNRQEVLQLCEVHGHLPFRSESPGFHVGSITSVPRFLWRLADCTARAPATVLAVSSARRLSALASGAGAGRCTSRCRSRGRVRG